ncbi:hypothetical protein AVEN_209516-1 [Araneus ventricosus]|uniref:Uncharacterized protein n=1 Tax=Araneus ventricosus TaxID=182803 RepID=A0A4Y2IQE6_ARAVE|nr:hypothetical protein AVEN_209516-1 [Araneus ventricosus]
MKERALFFHPSSSWGNFSSAFNAFLPTRRRSSLAHTPSILTHNPLWGLAWPVKEGHMTARELVLDVFGSVFRIIILLKNEATTKRIACIRTHGVLKDVFILKLIHDSLNPPQGTHAKARGASPNHDISTRVLQCWNLVLGVEKSALGTTNPLYPKQHILASITPKDIFLGPVLVRLRPFHTSLAILSRDHRFLDGASSIQCSCLKPTPDSTNRGFGFGGHKAHVHVYRRQVGIDRRKT